MAAQTAWIIAIGSEMLTPFRVDTNSLHITQALNELGYDVRFKAVVADDVVSLADLFRRAFEDADLVIATGGLGPTEDDITRQALAAALDVPLDVDDAVVERIRQRFARRNLVMSEINKRQALVPRGAVILPNANGTAPGLWVQRGRTAIVLLPGPPREMAPMLDALVAERLALASTGGGLFRRVLKITGRNESDVDAHAQPVYGQWTSRPVPISTTILAVNGQIELHLTAAAANRSEADAVLSAAVDELYGVFGNAIYSADGRSIEEVVGDLLRERQWTLSVAESCTGGLLASRLTDVPGSSDYVQSGVVCYSNRAKTDLAGVSERLIVEHGAVSEQVAEALATGIRARARTSIGIGVTGIAGPGGGSPDKPVGMVCIAVVADQARDIRTYRFLGGRELVKYQSATAALNMLRLMLLSLHEGAAKR